MTTTSAEREIKIYGPGYNKATLVNDVWSVVKDFNREERSSIAVLGYKETIPAALLTCGCVAIAAEVEDNVRILVSVIVGMPNERSGECDLTVATVPEFRGRGNFKATCKELTTSCCKNRVCPIERVVAITESPEVR